MKQLNIIPNPLCVKIEKTDKPITPHGGLLLIASLVKKLKIAHLLDSVVAVKQRKRGYSEAESILGLAYTLIAGGECLDDMEKLRNDEGLKFLTGGVSTPHPTTGGNFLRRFDLGHIKQLEKAQAIIHRKLFPWMPYKGSITLDLDSSIFPFYGNKEGADWTYDGQWGYHPLFAFIGETSECLHLWLRRGNTYSGKDSPRFLKESLGILSRSIRRIKVRGDSAFYSSNFVQECESRNVDFTVTADQTAPLIERVKALPQESWRAFGEEEIAEFRYQPAGWDKSYRYIVMREKYKASEQIGLFSGGYKYQILVTSMKGCAEGLMQFHRKRATIENCIKEMKNGFSLEHIPTGKFHANWVYLLIGKLAYNLSIWLKYIAFPFKYRRMGIKRLRFWFFSVAGYIIKRGRQIILRIYSKDENWFKVFTEASIIIKSLEFR